MQLGRIGVWNGLDALSSAEAVRFAQQVEAWGYGALWIPEGLGREPFAFAAHLLGNTKTLVIATGVANIYARDALTARAGQLTLNEQSGGRFLLGLGVSHTRLVESVRGLAYGKPIATMRAYLDAMDRAPSTSLPPDEPPPRVLAALGPKMLALSAARADGAHPYLVTPEHTARARKILGPDKLLCVEQMVILDSDPVNARKVSRDMLKLYFSLPNYCNNLLTLGFTQSDLDTASDRIVDALVAWGDEKTIEARIKAHLDAGASHVCIQARKPDGSLEPDMRLLEALAPNRT